MAMKRCPVCGEKYSDTYKECPFCEEERELQEGGGRSRKSARGGRRTVARSRQFSLITPTLIVLIILMTALLVYLLWGSQLAERFGGSQEDPATEDVVPGGDSTGDEDPDGTMPSGTDDTDNPDDTQTDDTEGTDSTDDTQDDTTETTDYETAMALPDGLTLSTTDFTLRTVGETATIRVSGGSGSYTWISEDEGVASVSSSGVVTAVSGGTINVVVTDGTRKGVCIVRCNVSGSSGSTTTSGGSSTTTSGGSGTLQAGAAVVINGDSGVYVRSGPGTSYEALATVYSGDSVRIVSSAGDGWYQITFSGSGGVDTTGYMRSDFLQNQ